MTAKRGSVRHDVRLDCPPDQAWAVVGAPERVHEWFPGIDSCTVEGDQRVVVTGSGLPMPEHLVTVDPTLRRLQYRITAPLFAEHLSTIDVLDLGADTCLVVYSVDAEPAPLALVIGGAAREGLQALPARFGPGPA
ncbi:MAG: SRPBCC family protein [Acidimicrobiales bacterium]